MKVYDFTEPELAFYKEFADFSPQEEKLFELRKRNIPLEECTKPLGCEYENVKKISRRVNKKIIKISDSKKIAEWINCVYWPKIIGK